MEVLAGILCYLVGYLLCFTILEDYYKNKKKHWTNGKRLLVLLLSTLSLILAFPLMFNELYLLHKEPFNNYLNKPIK